MQVCWQIITVYKSRLTAILAQRVGKQAKVHNFKPLMAREAIYVLGLKAKFCLIALRFSLGFRSIKSYLFWGIYLQKSLSKTCYKPLRG